MQKANFHISHEIYRVYCISEIINDENFLNTINKIGCETSGLKNYGKHRGEIVFNLSITVGKTAEIFDLISEKHIFYVQKKEEEKNVQTINTNRKEGE